MIHSARPTASPVVEISFVLKSGDGRTNGRHVKKQFSLPAVTVGRQPRGSIQIDVTIYLAIQL